LNSHGNTFLLNPVYQGEKPQRSTKFEYWFHANSCLHRKASFNKFELKFCKFILGVNSKSSNVAVLSELGRFPIYFNIVLSMISYIHRLQHCSSNLLKEAFKQSF
jgi:hypothetical protein